MPDNKEYIDFINQVKQQILQSRYQATKLINREMLLLYYSIGKTLTKKMNAAKWGDKILQNIAADLQKELPGLRGFSHRSLKKMRRFYETYQAFQFGPLPTARISHTAPTRSSKNKIRPLPTAQSEWQQNEDLFFSLSFTHHMELLQISNLTERTFYMQQAAAHHWTVSLLQHHIQSDLFHNKGKLPNNFSKTLSPAIAAHATDAFKDEYLLDFININPDDEERVLENEIISNIRQFILSLGTGFSFIGNQYRLIAEEEEFFTDLLFFNRILQCLVAIELKKGKFKPEYAGKLNFYLNVLDEQVKLPHENNSIGIILCKEKNNKIVEYAFKTIDKAMGVATYKTSKQLPAKFKKVLPDVEALKKLL